MILFFVDNVEEEKCILAEDEFIHCCKVLRHKENDTINFTNGKGIFGTARITEIKKKYALLDVISTEQNQELGSYTILAVAPPKNRSRWEWLLEKSVEIGVNTIIPMTSSHSERVNLNIERSKKIMRSAALQSKRIIHPTVLELTKFANIITSQDYSNFDKFIAHFNSDNAHLNSYKYSSKNRIILIGPEGDFSQEEVALAIKNEFVPVNISNNRLRTETAAIVATNFLV
ncbi:MAG: 16S rRNA (uracil(1498)-N(3))-methyltransferase [Saprospiraceae bacterium]|nr:16S rRNA (uracil(1498)-N(3))-methyltransferase [Bacteroidia bacterium]NNE13782.1 16S rRNA (uracil(1498)-N(3))-methyltransferase [Saprospiraceae bacterium]NNL90674.1 16S rRNA (uracil(1498)-N(3))-methyltransferase [Saprospiraceae bacterium]